MSNELAELKERNARLSLLIEISNVIHSTLDPEEALNLILREAIRVMRATSGSVVLVNPTNGLLEIQASQGLPHSARQLRLRVGEGITGWVARAGQPARVSDVRADPRYITVNSRARSELAVPLEVQGEVRGVLIHTGQHHDPAMSEQFFTDLGLPRPDEWLGDRKSVV